MPELPEVETIKNGLKRTVQGKKIQSVEIRLPKIVSLGPAVVSNIRRHSPKKTGVFARILRGQKIVDISRRAKMFIIKLSGSYTLLVHLKMTGQLIFAKPHEWKKVKILNMPNSRAEFLPHQYTHAIFKFSDGSRLYYNDLRQFGYLRLVHNEDLGKVKELAEYGPEPFSSSFTIDYLRQRAQRRASLSVKQFLMDPKVVAGIGNIYSDEILYWAGLRPTRRLRSLTRMDWQKLWKVIPRVLKRAVKAGGSSVGDFFKVDGTEGQFGKEHMVYGRAGETCYTCGEMIARVKLGGRTSSYCPVCQR